VATERLAPLDDGPATVHAHHSPVPELVLGQVPQGTHVLVLTHDHAEDFAICDAALRCGHLASIGLIGSSAKWQRFRRGLLVEGHAEATVDRIQSPIGRPGGSKEPAAIAVNVAAQLVEAFTAERAVAR
jgi:xanthine dehydrogenase accessory factor